MIVLALWFATGFLALGALIGLLLLSQHVKRRRVPVSAAVAHGLVAAIGLGLVIWFAVGARPQGLNVGPWPLIAATVLLLTACGGAVLFWMHLRGRPLPVLLMGVHAAAGILGIVIVIMLLQVRAETGGPVPLDPSATGGAPVQGK